tara:strand:- start:69 stop:566 length:498 start_codon:yes stop_codon:yes gene_type:complete
MKLLFENWRGYLAEEEPQTPQKCVTVGSLMIQIDKMQRKENVSNVISTAFSNLAQFIPVIGGAVSTGQDIVDYFGKAKDFLSKNKINYDKIEDFPILGHLKLDPELIKVIEDDILLKLDEMYEEEVLSKLEPTTCIDKIPSINDFIREKIAIETKNHVVIKDEAK